ncbi:MAG: hypothetical protein M3O82_06120, partial [Verrucomicrobiota bacterium]|nr:hypothetical protein [Verrucomicrobiota bacterium]
MRILCSVVFLFVLQIVALGRESAYQALRTLGKERGQSLLNRVVEVTGLQGTSQPDVWKIVIDDPAARGGIRELEVSKGHVISERAPVRGAARGAVMNFQKLNLDSEGAFTIANQEASRARVGFDTVDYVLRRDEQTQTPVWQILLKSGEGQSVGRIGIAADSGVVTRREGFGRKSMASADIPPEHYDEPPPDEPDRERRRGRINVGHEIDKYLHRAG